MKSFFISDLHLAAERPETIRLFTAFLSGPARSADAVYILGDLFEAWIGDDLVPPEYETVLDGLGQVTGSGIEVCVMHGNRDFLLGGRFADRTGCRLIDDPTVIDLHGVPTLLTHGDTLCTDDVRYQQLRRTLRDPGWIEAFLAKPPAERIAVARELRNVSAEEIHAKQQAIMDVNEDAVASAFGNHGVRRLIHGHTHRPGSHTLQLDGAAVERFVLGEWTVTGNALVCDFDGCRFEEFTP